MTRPAVVVAALLLPAVSMARETTVSFESRRAIRSSCEVRALQFDVENGPREAELDPPAKPGERRAVDVPATATAIVAITSGCLADRLAYTGSASVAISLWPAAAVVARFADTPRSGRHPSVSAAFVDVTQPIEQHRSPCSSLDDGRAARCDIPAAREIHLRLDPDGFAPRYLGNIAAEEGQTIEEGPLDLEPAHVLRGRVEDAAGAPQGGARIEIAPLASAELDPAARLIQTRIGVTNAKGEWLVRGVARGTYTVRSVVRGLPDATIAEVEVDEDARIARLVHRRAAPLEVVVRPPAQPGNELWRLRVTSRGAKQSEVVLSAEGAANPAGVWTSDPLAPGEYEVKVVDAAGSEVARQQVVINGVAERVFITIEGIAVTGVLRAGDEPVAGILTFRSTSGLRVRAHAADGRFTATFPVPGAWRVHVQVPPDAPEVRVEDVSIEAGSGRDLTIVLPGGAVKGSVSDVRGRPAAAIVTLRRAARIVAQTRTVDGEFELRHVPEGRLTVDAEGDEGYAPPVPIDAGAEKPVEVELRLDEVREVRGVVVAPSGRGASGAVVRVFEADTGDYGETIADAEGRFSMTVKTRGAIDVFILPPPSPVIVRRFQPEQWQRSQLTITVPADGGILRLRTLRLPPWPVMTPPDGISRPLLLFVMPRFGGGPMREFVDGAFQFVLEAGPWRICSDGDCRSLTLSPGAATGVDFIPVMRRAS